MLVSCLAASIPRQVRVMFENSEKVNIAAEVRGTTDSHRLNDNGKNQLFLIHLWVSGKEDNWITVKVYTWKSILVIYNFIL